MGEELKQRLFNQKESGWDNINEAKKDKIFKLSKQIYKNYHI